MSPRLTAIVAVLAALAMLGVGFAIGWSAQPARRPGALGGSGPGPSLTLVAAGSLAPVLPPIVNAWVNSTSGAVAPTSAERFEGSTAALNSIAQLGQAYDVAVVADYRLIPSILEPRFAGWEVAFATDPLVLAYDPGNAAFAGVTTSTWAADLTKSGVILGVANASTDPLGYNAINALQLEGLLESGSRAAVYGQFFSGAPGQFAVPLPGRTLVTPEQNAATFLASHVVGAYFVYRSYAVVSKLSYVELSASVNLGSTAPADAAEYANASTTVQGATGPTVEAGRPILFAATVPSNAPDPPLGQLFLSYLFGADGETALATDGFEPLAPPWTDHAPSVPGAVLGDAVPFPLYLPP